MNNEIIERLKVSKEKIEQAEKEYQKAVCQGLRLLVTEFSKKYPIVQGIFWSQYTPYFNDGDVCKFRISNFGLVLCGLDNAETFELEEYDEPDDPDIAAIVVSPEFKEDYQAIESFIYSNESSMESAFGDHCKVWIMYEQDQAVVESYEHHD